MFQFKPSSLFKMPQIRVFRLWPVRLACTETALNLAVRLMTEKGYSPTKRERGIAQWEGKEKSSGHNCFICFRSYRGLNSNGYVGVDACSCQKPQPLQEIVETFEKEMRQCGLFASPEEQLFHITGTSY